MDNLLTSIVRDAKVAFVVAKYDGKLEASEVVEIAVMISKRVHAITGISEEQKDALIIHSLKQGLSAAGGLQGLTALEGLAPEIMEVVEQQILSAAVASIKVLRDMAPHVLNPLKNKVLSFFSRILAGIRKFSPKDATVLETAMNSFEKKAKNIYDSTFAVGDVKGGVTQVVAAVEAGAAMCLPSRYTSCFGGSLKKLSDRVVPPLYKAAAVLELLNPLPSSTDISGTTLLIQDLSGAAVNTVSPTQVCVDEVIDFQTVDVHEDTPLQSEPVVEPSPETSQ